MQILNTLNVPYETVNILEDDLLRTGMKEYSQWPTFPQVYIDGEFYGGCDIMIGIHKLHISLHKYQKTGSQAVASFPLAWHIPASVDSCDCSAESYTNGELKEYLEAALIS